MARMYPTVESGSELREEVRSTGAGWMRLARVAFRFTFVYWALYLLPQQGSASLIDLLPWGSEAISVVLRWPLARLTQWVGVHLFHLQGEAATWHPTGSGDTALSWVACFCILVIAVLMTVIWSAVAE